MYIFVFYSAGASVAVSSFLSPAGVGMNPEKSVPFGADGNPSDGMGSFGILGGINWAFDSNSNKCKIIIISLKIMISKIL